MLSVKLWKRRWEGSWGRGGDLDPGRWKSCSERLLAFPEPSLGVLVGDDAGLSRAPGDTGVRLQNGVMALLP